MSARAQPAELASACGVWQERMAFAAQGPVELHFMAFTAELFDPARFAGEGIACPPAVLASVHKRQAEYLAGRMCARAGLQQLGLHHGQVGTGRSREPLWPSGVLGSISHSQGLACALVRRQGALAGIGIDLERVIDDLTMRSMPMMVVGEGELAVLRRAQPAATLNTLLTIAFSAKESFFKATFGVVRRYFGFEAIAVEAIDLPAGTIGFVLIETLSPQLQRGQRCQASFRLLDNAMVLTLFSW